MKWDYRGEFVHSIWFLKNGENTPKNSIEDFLLFPDNRYTFKVGDPDFLNEEIKGRSGSYDWWKIVKKRVPLKKADDSMKFYVITDYYDYDWIEEFESLVNYFDGSVFKMWLNDEPDKVATGRVWIDSSGWDSPSSGTSTVTLKYTLTKEVEDDK